MMRKILPFLFSADLIEKLFIDEIANVLKNIPSYLEVLQITKIAKDLKVTKNKF